MVELKKSLPIMASDIVPKVSFTGSTDVAKTLIKQSAYTLSVFPWS
ncbi:hypothetical protein P9443_04905 [Peribacillus frigoritolerans]|nr:hypothetical protein [Peribacillus frigoritolerans]